ncbi:succinate dehydrogenase, cytochrome b556 subunit [Sphingomonas sp. AR_OL41]|nr:succinate dehydrogenase, cytochrome b556 subunit [Sphingomonas sp. AR_OL41]MDH7975109.1 succinate dehydrogenase, cytochrome b556 subunit [Sphingomonas sp. AR_OL41]
MATDRPARPISPHLMHVRWPITMMVSIIHRITGDGMALVGTLLLVWWLAALAAGPASYESFTWLFGSWAHGALGYVVGVGLTFSLFQHIAGGIRHFVMDTGAGYELKGNRMVAWLTLCVSTMATILFWAYLLGGK